MMITAFSGAPRSIKITHLINNMNEDFTGGLIGYMIGRSSDRRGVTLRPCRLLQHHSSENSPARPFKGQMKDDSLMSDSLQCFTCLIRSGTGGRHHRSGTGLSENSFCMTEKPCSPQEGGRGLKPPRGTCFKFSMRGEKSSHCIIGQLRE